MLMEASASSGPPTINASLVTERDNSESPLWSDVASEDSRARPGAGPNRQASEKPAASAIPLAAVWLSSGGRDEEQQLAEQLAGQDGDHREVEQSGGGHERAEAAGRQGQACGDQRQKNGAEHPEGRKQRAEGQRMGQRPGAVGEAAEREREDDRLQDEADQQGADGP